MHCFLISLCYYVCHNSITDYVYENVFDHLWNWDCESMHYDIESAVKLYIERK